MAASSVAVDRRRLRVSARANSFFLIFVSLAGSAHAADYAAVRSARLDGRSIGATNLRLERDAFTLHFGPGRFHFLAPVDGHTFGAVFLGQGKWELNPATESERRYLGLVLGDSAQNGVSDNFDSMVLFFLDGTMNEILAQGAIESGAVDARAAATYERHLQAQREQWGRNLHLRVYRALLEGNEPFYGFASGGRLVQPLLVVDPEGFIDGEETALILEPRHAQHIYSSHLREEVATGRGAACRRPERLDALHYAIDTRVRKDTAVDAVATLRFAARSPGQRVVPLELLPSLRIREAALLPATGPAKPLAWIQEPEKDDAEAAIVLAEPLGVDEEATVRLTYSGEEILDDDGDGNFKVLARTSWYPNLGFGDFATYELTFRTPPKKQVVAVGTRVALTESEGDAVSHWRSDVPIPIAGFNYGVFRRLEQTEKNTATQLEVFTNPGTPDAIEELNDMLRASTSGLNPMDALSVATSMTGYQEGLVTPGNSRVSFDTEMLAQAAMADALNAVQIYSLAFGKLPFERIAVTQQSEWAMGQGWPTLIFLPYLGALSSTARAQLGLEHMTAFADQVGLHEMAHQWWGNRVGFDSYRDQWISEGFSEFSVAVALQTLYGRAAYDSFWEAARRTITTKPRGSAARPFETGPMTLGWRLNTQRNPIAYDVLAYSKGAYVLHMLRMMMRDDKAEAPDARFFDMLRDFVATHSGRSATTEDFKRSVEKHMVPELNATRDGKIDWFFDQWVYGTDIPSYTAKVEIEKAEGGKWRLQGSVSQSGVSDSFLALVPLYLEFDKGRFLQIAKSPFKGNMTHPVDVTLALPEKPKRVRVNLQHEVLALEEP